jgi:acetylornithine/N-succinyldiaminopimelate aminotransferase
MGAERTTTAIQNEQNYIVQTYRRPAFVLERGEGVYLYDTGGQQYLDFVAGIGVNALGYGDAEIMRTIGEQAGQLLHVSNLYHTLPGGELARMLVERTPWAGRVFFCNSGGEAVEGALKMARRYARRHHGEKTTKTTIVAFDGSFHGRTMGAVAITSREAYRRPFEPVMPGVRFAPFNDVAALETAITDDVCAVIVEPVQGEGGLRPASNEFLHRVRERCNAIGALLILDEIQCGMGRTGHLWAHEHAGVQPDVMTLAKPLGGGLPIGAIVARSPVADALAVGEHGTTFGGGPLVTAVAHVVLQRISDPAFLERVRHVGDTFEQALQSFAADHAAQVREVRGRGLMRGLQIAGDAAAIREACHQEGLLIATSGPDVLRFLPPLIITEAHIAEAMGKLRAAWERSQS